MTGVEPTGRKKKRETGVRRTERVSVRILQKIKYMYAEMEPLLLYVRRANDGGEGGRVLVVF